jgi:glycosyltransferase involved in cell wall biosynthesis
MLGAVLARRLRDTGVEHIHAYHGYYASWIAMVAARLLGIRFSLSLHGSDLLVNASYLDLKLQDCEFCRTISEYNRQHILANFPTIPAEKILVKRLGVDVPVATVAEVREKDDPRPLRLLAVGRLHAVKNHQFLVRACYLLREAGVPTECWIVGEGPERRGLEFLIGDLHLEDAVRLVGAVPREQVGCFYDRADLVVLTSRSEGIPLVLMEAMARARIVLAPAITGIPELVIDGKTGFLYQPGDLEEFVRRVDQIWAIAAGSRWHAASGAGTCANAL